MCHIFHLRILGCDKINVTSIAKDIILNGTEPQEKQKWWGLCPHLVGFYLKLLKIHFSFYFTFWPEKHSVIEFLLSSLQEGTVFADHQEEKERLHMIYWSNQTVGRQYKTLMNIDMGLKSLAYCQYSLLYILLCCKVDFFSPFQERRCTFSFFITEIIIQNRIKYFQRTLQNR